jgi:hypothetical protein
VGLQFLPAQRVSRLLLFLGRDGNKHRHPGVGGGSAVFSAYNLLTVTCGHAIDLSHLD